MRRRKLPRPVARSRRWALALGASPILALALLSGWSVAGDGGEVMVATALAVTPPGAVWAVDPEAPGPNLPPAGRSLFDFLVARPDGAGYDVPFPFSRLLERVEERLGVPAGEPSPLKKVLIPLGRSLQRNAGAPEFFRFPRAVVAVDTEPHPAAGSAGMLLKDRLYVGYQEKAAIVEVISYNEAAGRFEFQLVKDYRPGGRPGVFYANRAICATCHQGASPIFARQLWDETDASREVTHLLRAQEREFYDFSLDQGVDVPYAVDVATDRANRFAAYQLLWRQGCGGREPEAARCRGAALIAALQRALSGGRGFERSSERFQQELAAPFHRTFRERWPGGLLIPDPDIPNRDPLRSQTTGVKVVSVSARLGSEELGRIQDLIQGSRIPAPFEPLNPRAPLEVWTPEASFGGGRGVGDGDLAGEGALDRLIAGLGELLAAPDLQRLDAHLLARGGADGARRERLQAPCRLSPRRRGGVVDRLKLQCESGEAGLALRGRIYLSAGRVTGGNIERLAAGDGLEMVGLAVTGGQVRAEGDRWVADLAVAQKHNGLTPRRPDGSALERLEIGWWHAAPEDGQEGVAGEVTATFLDDFAALEAAVDELAARTSQGESDVLSAAPFRRAAVLSELFSELGMEPLDWCCLDGSWMPPPALENGTGQVGETFATAGAEPFFRYCALCHDTPGPSPPNFLRGSTEEVRANLAHCAERIFFRLEMWRLAAGERPKTPMPPVNALPALHLSREEWPSDPDLAVLKAYVADLSAAERGRNLTLEELEARGYDRLRGCLPERPGG